MKQSALIAAADSLDIKKSTGIDGISATILKASAKIVSPSLLKTMNISLYSGLFPDALKIAKIIPIHKGGSKHDPSNYRPISILSVLS